MVRDPRTDKGLVVAVIIAFLVVSQPEGYTGAAKQLASLG